MTLTEDIDEILRIYLKRVVDGAIEKNDESIVEFAERSKQIRKEVAAQIKAAHHQDIEEAVRVARINELENVLTNMTEYGVYNGVNVDVINPTPVEDRLKQLQTKPDKVKEGDK